MEVGVGDTVGFGELGQVRLTCDLLPMLVLLQACFNAAEDTVLPAHG